MKRKSNIQIVNDIMKSSEYGALAQIFVMDALNKLAVAVCATKPSDYPEGSFVHPEAWIGVATEIKAKLDRPEREPNKPAKPKTPPPRGIIIVFALMLLGSALTACGVDNAISQAEAASTATATGTGTATGTARATSTAPAAADDGVNVTVNVNVNKGTANGPITVIGPGPDNELPPCDGRIEGRLYQVPGPELVMCRAGNWERVTDERSGK